MTRKAAYIKMHLFLDPAQVNWLKSESKRLSVSQTSLVRLSLDNMMRSNPQIGEAPNVDGLLDELLLGKNRLETP